MKFSLNYGTKRHYSIFMLLVTLILATVFAHNLNGGFRVERPKKLLILRFENYDKDIRLDALETTIPHIIRAGLLRYNWLDVMLFNELSRPSSQPRKTKKIQKKDLSPGISEVLFTLEGKIIKIKDKIRLDVILKDREKNSRIFAGFTTFSRDTILDSTESLVARLADSLWRSINPRAVKERIIISILQPFKNKTNDDKDDYLETTIPSSIISPIYKKIKIKNISFKRISYKDSGQENIAAQIRGEYVVKEKEIKISVKFIEKSGLTFPIQIIGSTNDMLKVIEKLSNRLLEVIKGRINPEGKWKKEPLFATEAESKQYFSKGKNYYQSGDYDSAILMFRKAIEKKPGYLDAYFYLADIYMERKDYSMAVSEYHSIIDINPQHASAHFEKGIAYLKMGQYDRAVSELEMALNFAANNREIKFKSYKGLGDIYLLKNNQQQAKFNYEKAIEINCENSEIYLALGQIYIGKEEYDKALQYFEKGKKLFPEKPEFVNNLASVYNKLGKIHYSKRNYNPAFNAFHKTIELSPKNNQIMSEAYIYAGIVLVENSQKRDVNRAIVNIKKAISLIADNEWYYRVLGWAYGEIGKYHEAIESYKHAISIEESFWSLAELAELYFKNKQYTKSLEKIRKAFQIEPDYSRGYSLLGAIYFYQAQDNKDQTLYNKGIKSLEKAISLDNRTEWAYRVLGIIYKAIGDYDKAVDNLNMAIDIKPTKWSYFELGKAYELKKNYTKAIESLKEALKIDRKYENAYTMLERICRDANKYEKYIEVLKETVKIMPKYYWALVKLGNAYTNIEKFDNAIEILESAISIKPQDEWVYQALGWTYFKKTEYEKAIENLNMAIDINPTKWSYFQLGKAYELKKNYTKAIESLKEALKTDRKYENAYTMLERICRDANKYEKYIEVLKKTVKIMPKYHWALVKLGNAYTNIKKFDKAIEILESAISIKPQDEWAYRALGWTYLLKQEYDKAVDSLNKAIEIKPTTTGYNVLGMIYKKKGESTGEYQKAIENFKKAIQSNPTSLNYVDLAETYRLCRNYDEAEKNVNKALKLSPKNANAFLILGKIQLDLGRYESVKKYARKTIDINPNIVEAYLLLADAFHRTKRTNEVVAELKNYLKKDPDNLSMLESLGMVYHEYLDDKYQDAYEILKRIYDLYGEDISIKANFTESNLTTGRFETALSLANEVLEDQNILPEHKLSMKLFAIASLLFLKEPAKAFAELGEFIRYYKSIPSGYVRSWKYQGTKNFIKKTDELRKIEKDLILELIDTLESPESEAVQKIKKFESRLSEILKKITK